jgi:hypothetical protein
VGIVRAPGSAWSARLHDIGNFQSRALLTVFYFTVFVPFAVITRVFRDPLRLKPQTGTGWQPWDERESGLDGARQQY